MEYSLLYNIYYLYLFFAYQTNMPTGEYKLKVVE